MMNSDLPFPLMLMRWGHVGLGLLSVAVLLIPLLSKKGGRIHARAGWVFVIAMGFVALSTFATAGWRCLFGPPRSPESLSYFTFLIFMAAGLFVGLQQGLWALKFKTRRGFSLGTAVLPISLFGVSVAMAIFAIHQRSALFGSFAFLNSLLSLYQIRYWLRPVRHGREWWFFHLTNMFYCATLALIAATVEIVMRVQRVESVESLWVWWMPIIGMGIWMAWFIRRFRRRFGLS